MVEVDSEKLREKVKNMPIITQKLRKIKSSKDGRTWFILETKIVQFISPKYVEKMMESDNDKYKDKEKDFL